MSAVVRLNAVVPEWKDFGGKWTVTAADAEGVLRDLNLIGNAWVKPTGEAEPTHSWVPAHALVRIP